MRQAIVHIGLNKTGSSTLQAWLEGNRDALRAQGVWHNDLAPHAGPAVSARTGWMFLALLTQKSWLPGPVMRQSYRIHDRHALERAVADFLDRAEQTLPRRDSDATYVTSSEHIGTIRDVESLRALHKVLSRWFDRVRYVAYIRDQVTWVPSAYVQAVRSGFPGTIEDFIDRHGKNDYLALVERWHSAVGADSFVLRRMDKALLADGDLIHDFAAVLRVDPAPLQRPANRNTRASGSRVAAQRWINRRLGPVISRAGLDPLKRRAFSAPLPKLTPWQTPFALTAQQSETVRRMNADSNEALRQKLFPQAPTLFPGSAPTPTDRCEAIA